ncbi:dUTP diphosphatase [Thermodesulfobacteriota bacterium]
MLENIKIRFMRFENGRDLPLPRYESEGASGMDLRAAVGDEVVIEPGEIKLIPTGMGVSIPQGFEGQIRPRSGLALKKGVGLVNSPGTIDSDYRGEIAIILINWGTKPVKIQRGDRIAQMLITRVYRALIMESDHLDPTPRGQGGFGHSGLK